MLDARLPLLYNMNMKYDLIDLPGEINDIPECGACYDTGIITDEDVFCDCPNGEAACDASDEMDCGDYEDGLFEDDGDALASAGMGTDEDYGGW